MQVRELTLEVCFVVPPRYSVDAAAFLAIAGMSRKSLCDVVERAVNFS